MQPDRARLQRQALADRRRDPGGVAAPQLRAGDLLEQRRCELALVGGLLLRVEAVADDDAVAGRTSGSGAPPRPRSAAGPAPQTMPMSMSATSPVGEVAPS